MDRSFCDLSEAPATTIKKVAGSSLGYENEPTNIFSIHLGI